MIRLSLREAVDPTLFEFANGYGDTEEFLRMGFFCKHDFAKCL